MTPTNTGCSKCLRANEISYDGKYYNKSGTSNTTKKPSVTTTKKTTVTTEGEGDYDE